MSKNATWNVWPVGLLGSLLVWGGCQSGPGSSSSRPSLTKRGTPGLTFRLCRGGLPEKGSWKCDPALADVNRDGQVDLAAHLRLGHGPQVWLGNGRGEWQDSSEGLTFGDVNSCGGGAVLSDVNGDGSVDLVVADHCQGVFVALGDGAGTWEMVTRALYPYELVPAEGGANEYMGAECVAVGDVNGDGHADLVAGASDDGGGISLYLGDGTGRNWQLHTGGLPTSGWTTRVRLTDLNGDGKLDLVACASEGPRAWLGDGQAGWKPMSEGLPKPAIKGIYNGLAAADVNEDGRPDIIAANWVDGPEVYLQQADGSWRKTPDVFPDMRGGAYGVAVGDLDRDGHLDLAVSGRLAQEVGYVYGVFVLKGDGVGGWAWVADCELPTTGLPFTWGLALGDVNGDGVLDVAAGSGGSVATNVSRSQPVLNAGVLLWCTQLSPR